MSLDGKITQATVGWRIDCAACARLATKPRNVSRAAARADFSSRGWRYSHIGWLCAKCSTPRRSGGTPHQRIVRAAAIGVGVELTATEVRTLACDDMSAAQAAEDDSR